MQTVRRFALLQAAVYFKTTKKIFRGGKTPIPMYHKMP